MVKVKSIKYSGLSSKTSYAVLLLMAIFSFIPASLSGYGAERVKVGIADFYPLRHSDRSGINEESDGGLFASLLHYVADQEDWNLELKVETPEEGMRLLEAGEIDFLAAIAYSKELSEKYDFTRESVISTWAQVFARRNSAVQSWLDLSGKVIGLLRDDPYNPEMRSIAKRFDMNSEFAEFKNYDAMFSALETGWIDAAVADRLSGTLLENNYAITRTSIVFSPIELRFAARKGTNQQLIAALDYHLNLLKKDPKSAYYHLIDRILGEKHHVWIPQSLVIGLLVAVSVASFLFITSFILRRKIKKRTEQLSANNKELHREILMRRDAEQALRESRERYRAIVEDQTELIGRYSPDGTISFVNEAFCRYFGKTAEEILGAKLGLLVQKEQLDRQREQMIGLCPENPVMSLDQQIVSPQGDNRWLRRTDRAIFDERSNIKEFQMVACDITERKRTEEALARSEKKLKALFEFAPEAIFLESTDGRIIDCNIAAEKMTGHRRHELLTFRTQELMVESAQNKKLHEWNLTMHDSGEILFRHKSGNVFPVQINSQLLELDEERIVLVIAHDLTERKKTEEELLKIEKLESIGILAGGIAHDFNNSLSAIMGNISLAQMYCNSEWQHEILKRLQAAEKASLRARDLTQQLLTFSKGGAPVKQAASVETLIDESLTFALTGSNVKGELNIARDLWPVEIDCGQISQVIHNIIINAQQAMPDGGTIHVFAQNLELNGCNGLSLKPGRYVKISIHDQGRGIPREHLSKIFDPYFTTKQKGNGLGLATSYSIVRNHGGKIHVQSTLGLGTTFYLYLPASGKEVTSSPATTTEPARGKGRILVMDDELMLRELIGNMLTYLGYQVKLTRDGLEAIETYREAKETGDPFHAVIMDLTIPGGLGGKDALRKIMEIDPNVNAIVSSGYANDSVMANYRKYGFKGVVIKPYRIHDLSEVLKNIPFN